MMSDQGREAQESKIIVDSDWKQEAAKEKAELDEKTKDVGQRGEIPEPVFAEIVNMIVMQAAMALGGMKSPDGKNMPPDPEVAKHYIDLLDLLGQKTSGQLEEEEKKLMETVLHEMRMHYVEAMGPAGGSPPASPNP
jgi:Domain of unknown function (DUF1844)